MIALFVAIVFSAQMVFGQGSTDNPILPRIYEEGYTIEQIKNFALGNFELLPASVGESYRKQEYSKNYREKVLSIVNEGLRRSGEYVNLNNGQPLDDSHIEWIYQHVYRVYNDKLPAHYRNTWKNGLYVSDCTTKTPYFGPLDHFKYGVCEIKLDKPSCANLTPDFSLLGYFVQKAPEKEPEQIVPERVVYTVAQPKVEPYVAPKVFELPKEPIKEKKQIKIWKIVIPIAALIGIAAYLLRPKGGPAPAPGYPADTGGPAGAPGYPADTGTSTGGPTGAPGYGG